MHTGAPYTRLERPDIPGPVDTTSRAAWERLVRELPSHPGSEYRRKRTRRSTVTGWVELTFEQAGRFVQQTGRLLELSPDGVQIKRGEEIEVDTLVLMHLELSQGEATLVGRVIHCTETLGGFKVGIRLLFDEQP